MARASTAVVLVAAASVGALALVAARSFGERRHQLTVAAVRQPATSLLFVAESSGCFAAERLDVTEQAFELGRDALVQLLDGGADVAVAYETPILRRFRDDQRLRVISALHSSTRNTRLVARRDRGVAGLSDLRGRTVSAAMGTNADFFVEHVLAFGGLTRDELKLVNLEPDAAVEALGRGAIDAAVLSDPHAERARRALGAEAVEIVSDLYAEYSMVATRADVIETRREALRAFLRGLICAERALHDDPAAAYAAVRKRFPERTDSELQVALERVHRAVALDEALWTVLRHEAHWMYSDAAQGRPAPDIRLLVDTSLLEEVDPTAVNMLARR